MPREIDEEWMDFCAGTFDCDNGRETTTEMVAPKSTPLYISTKTKICHLTLPIDLATVFWKLPMVPYSKPATGIIKKQMKFCSTSPEELKRVETNMRQEISTCPNYVNVQTLAHVVNPNGLIKFKDIRKISVGLSKKDIINNRSKQKSAFYNCFVVILRIEHEGVFKEINVKVFNTGKLEIPGIQHDDVLRTVLKTLTQIMTPIVNQSSFTYSQETETVLINSNFKCNYLIKRDQLVDILKSKYNIKCSYDPCSYPGIQCTFFFDPNRSTQTGVQPSEGEKDVCKVSFMIFRTGSVLIVGKCTEAILEQIYTFIRTLLETEYHEICDTTGVPPPVEASAAPKKRLRTFHIEV